MRPLLFAKADAAETFGIGPTAVTDAGAEIRVWDAIHDEPAPALDEVSGVVLFGSAYNIEHARERPRIERVREVTLDALDREVPFLGICFGAQVLAWSLNTPKIRKAPVREIGYVPLRPLGAAANDPLLSHYTDGDPVFQWHMDTFDLPGEAEQLATGDQVAAQAFRIGDRAWATQFHSRSTAPRSTYGSTTQASPSHGTGTPTPLGCERRRSRISCATNTREPRSSDASWRSHAPTRKRATGLGDGVGRSGRLSGCAASSGACRTDHGTRRRKRTRSTDVSASFRTSFGPARSGDRTPTHPFEAST